MKRLLLLVSLLPSPCLASSPPASCGSGGDHARQNGAPAPSFALLDSAGAEWRLDAQKGKVVVINFFATWCPPCMKEIPHLEKELWGALKDKGLVLVSLGRDHSVEEVAAFKAKAKLSYPVLSDPGQKAFSLYATKYIPRTVIVGRDGKVVKTVVGFDPGEFEELKATVARELDRK